MPITEHANHLSTIVVESGSESLEYHCAESADDMSLRVGQANADRPLVTFRDKQNHVIFVRARKVVAIETVYAHG